MLVGMQCSPNTEGHQWGSDEKVGRKGTFPRQVVSEHRAVLQQTTPLPSVSGGAPSPPQQLQNSLSRSPTTWGPGCQVLLEVIGPILSLQRRKI